MLVFKTRVIQPEACDDILYNKTIKKALAIYHTVFKYSCAMTVYFNLFYKKSLYIC